MKPLIYIQKAFKNPESANTYTLLFNRHRKKISRHKQEKILDDWRLNQVMGSEEWKKEEWKKRTRKRRGKKVGGSKYTKNKVHIYYLYFMSSSCHLDRVSNVKIGVECQIFVIVIFYNCGRVLQFGAHSRYYKGTLSQKR